jgi:hypothetical protein
MSSYLNFYVVPKLSKKKYDYNKDDGHTETEVKLSEGLPLLLLLYSRNNDVYRAYNETLNPAYAGMEDKYTEVTYEDAQRVVKEFEDDLKGSEQRLEINYKMLKEGGYSSELWEEIHSEETYIREQKETLEELKFIASFVYDVTNGYSDFEKVLINVD